MGGDDGTGPAGAPEDEPYRTVAGSGETAFEVRGSVFHGQVTFASGRGAADAFVEEVRTANPDATHVVPAYRVRDDEQFLREYADDDGEPSGSAGEPALTVLQRRELENVAAAVVREYGGTNLGVGGLARAYSRAVGDAVDDAGVRRARPQCRLTVTVGYDDSGTVRGILESEDVTFEASYEGEVSFEVEAPQATVAAVCDRLRSATGGRVTIED
ncbi:MAG: YigZ family protein [Halobacteriaceae archaeon]